MLLLVPVIWLVGNSFVGVFLGIGAWRMENVPPKKPSNISGQLWKEMAIFISLKEWVYDFFLCRKGKICSKRLKRSRSSDFIFKQSSSDAERRSFVDEEIDGWCSTCTSSDDSDYERWDELKYVDVICSNSP